MADPCPVCNGSDARHFMDLKGFNYYRCRNCLLEFISPQPGDAFLSALYSKNYYDAWGLEKFEQEVISLKSNTFLHRLNTVKAYLKSGSKILDCGCATGIFPDIAKASGYDAYGIEISTFAAGVCKQKHGDGKIFCGQMEDAFFGDHPEGKFQAVFMSDFIEHVRDPKKIILKAAALIDDGLLVITTPRVKSFSYRISGRRWFQYKSEHLFYFAPSNIRQLLQSCGFANVTVKRATKFITVNYYISYFNTYRHPVFTPLAKLAKFILPAFIKRKPFRTVLGDMMVVAGKRKMNEGIWE